MRVARALHGPNELPPEPAEPLWRRVLKQFDDLLVKARSVLGVGCEGQGRGFREGWTHAPTLPELPGPTRPPAHGPCQILLAAAAVDLALALANGETGAAAWVEPGVIGAILVANACVGVATEASAARAIDALKQYEAGTATVLRDGRLGVVGAGELVPGDVVDVAVGDKARGGPGLRGLPPGPSCASLGSLVPARSACGHLPPPSPSRPAHATHGCRPPFP